MQCMVSYTLEYQLVLESGKGWLKRGLGLTIDNTLWSGHAMQRANL